MKGFNNILCVMESQASGQCALERAVALAENNQAVLTVATVTVRAPESSGLPGGDLAKGELQSRLTDVQTQWLESLIEPFRARVDVNTLILTGTPFLEIIRAVLRNGYDLLIKCPESPDWLDRLFSGDDMHLLRKCPCPVWMVKPGSGESYKRVLAAVDVDDNYPPAELKTRRALNEAVIEIAGVLAVSEFAELHVVHAWQATGESFMRHGAFLDWSEEEVNAYVEQVRGHQARLLDELMLEAGEKLGSDAMDYLKPRLHLLNGPASRVIPALAGHLQVDCLVMGTVARTGIRGFIMGNTAETILEQVECSVLAIKPPGFVTPVALKD